MENDHIKKYVFQAATLSEARKRFPNEIPEEEIVVMVEETESLTGLIIDAEANSVEKARVLAKEKLPPNAEINGSMEVIRETQRFNEQVRTKSADDAKRTARNNVGKKVRFPDGANERNLRIASVKTVEGGKKGFLGIGRKEPVYSVDLICTSLVSLTYDIPPELMVYTVSDVDYAKFYLHGNVENGNYMIVADMVDRGVDIHVKNERGASPLIGAIWSDQHKIAHLLIDKGAAINRPDNGGFTPLMVACENPDTDLELIKKMIRSGADVNRFSNGGSTALMAAAKSGNLEAVKLLLDQGAEIDAANTDHNVTALIWAADQGHFSIVKYLVTKDANCDIRTTNGYSAHSIARENGHDNIFEFLSNLRSSRSRPGRDHPEKENNCMKTEISRRKMLQIGCAAIGGTILVKTTSHAKTEMPGSTPWIWKPIEPESIHERAYQSAWAKIGCMYGVVESIIGTLADKYGAPYNSFPVTATLYGSGGIGGIGSVCGTVNAHI